MRIADIKRNTNETQIAVSLDLEGVGQSTINTGVGFLDHMLILFASHGRFNLKVNCNGDTNVDDHHSVEDIGIAIGTAFKQALGDCKGIKRYANITLPMDEALVMIAIDISGRFTLEYGLKLPTEKIGSFDSELIEEFYTGFARAMGLTLHIMQLNGKNSHHIAEASFKAFGRALKKAIEIDDRFMNEIPSTKGVL